ncbi:MAG: amidohydrolase [Rhodobacter sp.]|uniref:M20 aminoacylase family protein n=1 Tax=Pararhodobacter sp. TaxID=2127056 RepID=UPI001D1C0216|nr:M20 aminoacylase family protein [Pararhodobacter sp.]MCB1346544.1 amidohydrolase [Paracoccaceae bacterium]MCC0072060.1 amidohydrolase [Rhodobacter sp.]HPD93378.1 M20 aminoacylase family protein [Pararhodobacter sp.]
MPVLNRIADYAEDMKTWRRHLHQHPETRFDCAQTAAFVAGRLREFGITEIHEGIARSGLVAIIEGQGDGPTIGLRADIDALPITEETGLPHASTVPGKMHACGHDGHTTMLLGAARYLAETRNFAGRVALIFQPAEEWGGGAGVMVQEGIMERFGIGQVYALHNAPGVAEGRFETRPGPIMAAVDTLTVTVTGRGGHGAHPEDTVDPVAAIVQMVGALQTIVSRNRRGTDALVISVTQIHTGSADNIIPETGWFCATIRTYDRAVQAMVETRCQAIVQGIAAAMSCSAVVDYERGYPATVNHARETAFATEIAAEVGSATGECDPVMGAEDFAFMLERRPGAYLFLGQGDSAGLHHPRYDFNDAVAPVGASFFARLVERAQPRA